jgi:uncharacterized protein (TIGR01244 family)
VTWSAPTQDIPERNCVKIVKVNDRLSVATGQPRLDQFADIAKLGFKSVINNRPDGEEAMQPDSASEDEAARALGMAYRQIPIHSGAIGMAEIEAQQKAVRELEGPVLAHCRSGTRSLNVWAIGEILNGRMRTGDLMPLAQQLGIDLGGAAMWVARNAPDKA